MKNMQNSVSKIMTLAAVVALLVPAAFWPSQTEAADSGFKNPTTASSVNFTGADAAWSNGNLVFSSNDNRAAATLANQNDVTQYLRVTGFGFNIPANSDINGIEVSVEKSRLGTGGSSKVRDNIVKLVKNNVVVGDNKAVAEDWPATDTYKTYGGSGDTWSESWTVNDINNSNFGVVISAKMIDDNNNRLARVDHVKIKVYYTEKTTATLTLVKQINNSGPAQATDWALSASGPTQISGVTGSSAVTNAEVLPGTYTLSESEGPVDYVASVWSCSNGITVNAQGQINLTIGQKTTCTIINTYTPPAVDICPNLPDVQIIIPEGYHYVFPGTCEPNYTPMPLPENTCLLPNVEGGSKVTLGSSPEKSVQQILTEAGYPLNANLDQTNQENWNSAGASANIEVTKLEALSSDPIVFGYYVDDSSSIKFIPLFENGNHPLFNAPAYSGTVATSTLATTSPIVFAINTWDGQGYSHFYSTKPAHNDSDGTNDHAVVYNPSTNEYIIGFEDLPFATSDKDYNDLVVKVKVLNCFFPDDNCGGGQNPVEPAHLQVKIFKYLDGILATAEKANNYDFPMFATWSWPTSPAIQGNTGSGEYSLGPAGHGGSDPYAAYTSVMNAPATYQTYEITSDQNETSQVLPIGATCSEGKFRLKGYRVGNSLSEAQNAELTSSYPDFTNPTLSADKYVIVENETCPKDQVICESGFHLEENQCVADENNGGSGDNGGNGGGPVQQAVSFSGGHRHGGASGSSSGGEVLGASTEGPACEPYLKKFIKFGGNNDPEEVKKLQTFLNQFFETNIPVTGFYGSTTLEWVNKFQNHQKSAVLVPWTLAGWPTEGPTGYVYKTTQRWINILKCPQMISSSPLPQLP